MNILVNRPFWFIRKTNTDYNMQSNLIKLESQFPDLKVFYTKSLFHTIYFNFRYLIETFNYRLKVKFLKRVSRYSINEDIIFKKDITRAQPDLILSQGNYPLFRKKIPVLWEIMLVEPPYNSQNEAALLFWNQILMKIPKYAQKASIINLRSDYSIELAKKVIPEFAFKCVNIPYYLTDVEPISEDEVFKKHNNDSIIKILFVGAEAKRKGIILLIEAFRSIYSTNKNIQLHIISSFADGKVFIPDDLPIFSHGSQKRKQTIQLFKESHIYAMPSQKESFGISYIEGMANGCLVCVRDQNPQKEIVDFGNAGMLISIEDPKDIAMKIISLIDDRDLRIKLALNGLNRFKQKYYWKAVGEQWYNVLKTLKG